MARFPVDGRKRGELWSAAARRRFRKREQDFGELSRAAPALQGPLFRNGCWRAAAGRRAVPPTKCGRAPALTRFGEADQRPPYTRFGVWRGFVDRHYARVRRRSAARAV